MDIADLERVSSSFDTERRLRWYRTDPIMYRGNGISTEMIQLMHPALNFTEWFPRMQNTDPNL